jgi:mRNA-degrading endonuclease RelE of RelBE toxin-antitoxin system
LGNLDVGDYGFDDSYPGFQRDLGSAPKIVKKQLEEKRSLLRKDPFRKEPFEVVELRARYKGKRKINLMGNYRYVFWVNIQSHKICSYELRPRSKSYMGI